MKTNKAEQLDLDFDRSQTEPTTDGLSNSNKVCQGSSVDYSLAEKIAERERKHESKRFERLIQLAKHIS